MRYILAILALSATFMTGAAGAMAAPRVNTGSVTGTWTFTFTTSSGSYGGSLVLTQKGKKITGSVTAEGNTETVAGTISAARKIAMKWLDTDGSGGLANVHAVVSKDYMSMTGKFTESDGTKGIFTATMQ